MISFRCKCGAVIRAKEQFAGKRGRCPTCGAVVQIPPPAPATGAGKASRSAEAAPSSEPNEPSPHTSGAHAANGQPPSNADARDEVAAAVDSAPPDQRHLWPRSAQATARNSTIRNVPAMVVAGLMLLTLFLPWFVAGQGSDRDVAMSWDVLNEADGAMVAFLITAWIVALTALGLGFALQGPAVSGTNLGLGLLGIVLFLVAVASVDMPGTWRFASEGAALAWLALVLLIGLAIAAHLRLRIGSPLALRVFQGGLAVPTVVLLLVHFILRVVEFGDLPKPIRQELIFDCIFIVATSFLALAVCVTSMAAAATIRRKARTLSIGSLVVLYTLVGADCVYVVVRPATLSDEWGIALPIFNMLLLCGGLVVLLANGAVNLVCDLRHLFRQYSEHMHSGD